MSARALAVSIALCAGVAPVAADPATYQAAGTAVASDADARTRALDAAFTTAVTEAVADLAGKAARTQAAAVEREITRRARRFVASFRVTAERTTGDRLEVEVTVKIDRDKLAAKLVELGVELRAAPAPEPPPVSLPSVAVLYRVIGDGAVRASFGDGASPGLPGQGALADGLARAGYRLSTAPVAGPPPDDDGELPLDDASARALAAASGEAAVLVASVAVGAAGPVRGAPIVAAPARARLRLLDVGTGRAVTDLSVAAAAWGARDGLVDRAADAAGLALARQAFGERAPVDAAATAGPPIVAASGVTVRVVGPGAWQAAALVRADLLASPGVGAARYAGVAADAVVLGVDGLTVERAAAVAKGTPGFQARTRIEDGVVVVRVKSIDVGGAP